MGEAKPWQIAVVVAGLLVLLGSILWQCSRGGVDFAETMTFVDVTTGEVFVTPYRTDKSLVIPAYNPKTKQDSLYPIVKNEAGDWTLMARYKGGIADRKLDAKAIKDIQTGTVTPAGEPQKVDLYKVQAAVFTDK